MAKNPLNYLTNEMFTEISKINEINIHSLQKQPIYKTVSGIYFLFKNDELVYIGKSTNIFKRVLFHQFNFQKDFDNFSFTEVIEDKLDLYERFLINKFKPIYNVDHVTKKIKSNEI